jgi:hypothetical protein
MSSSIKSATNLRPIAGRLVRGMAAVTCAATLAACAAVSSAAAHTPSSGSPAGASSPSATSSAPAEAVHATATPAAPSPTPNRARLTAAHTCSAAEFSGAVSGDGAAGSLYITVTVTNHGASCTLTGRPVLFYTQSGGGVATLPYAHIDTGLGTPTSVLVRHGQSANMTIRTPDGYGGYPPSSARCQHPASYQGISIGVGTGRVALHGFATTTASGSSSGPEISFALNVKCDGVTLWTLWANS